MALARLALRNLSKRVSSSSAAPPAGKSSFGGGQRQSWNNELLKRFMTTSSTDKVAGETSDGKEVSVAVGEQGKNSKLFPRRKGRKSIWKRTDDSDFVPSLQEFFPSGLGNALMQATQHMNRLLQNLDQLSPSNLIGRVKEKGDHYMLRLEVPGVSKEDLKVTVDDGVLRIRGEHKEEEEDESDEEHWSARSYGYYDTSLMLPDDAKVDDIKAELKHGVLFITIPRTEKPKKDEREVTIH